MPTPRPTKSSLGAIMSGDPHPKRLSQSFVRLDPGGAASSIEVGATFWEDLSEGRLGALDWLVSQYAFTGTWAHWERHLGGEEFVFLLSGAVDFTLELDDEPSVVSLRSPGQYILVPRGVWHIGSAVQESSMLFITSGEGTEHRPA